MNIFLLKRKPRSYNNRNRAETPVYHSDVRQAFDNYNCQAIQSNELYARVYYFHSERTTIDADNLSKPIMDALKGKAYVDDNVVVHRTAARIDLASMDIQEFDAKNIPENILLEMFGSSGLKDFLYIEVGKFSKDMMKFGG